MGPIFATASREDKSGDVILKVVNVAAEPQPLQIALPGARNIDKTAHGEVLSGQPQDVNSLESPEHVAPKALTITNAGSTFVHEFPAYSVSVIRLKVK